jgi:hypothetical protein
MLCRACRHELTVLLVSTACQVLLVTIPTLGAIVLRLVYEVIFDLVSRLPPSCHLSQSVCEWVFDMIYV